MIFVTNVSALQQLNAEVLAKDVHLFAIKPTVQRVTWSFGANDRLFSQNNIVTPNEPNGMQIRYYLKSARLGPATVVVTDARGTEVARLQGTATAGVNTVVWNMLAGGGPAPGRGGGGRGPGYSPELWVPLGTYTVTLEIGGQKVTQPARITKTQGWTLGPVPSIIREPS